MIYINAVGEYYVMLLPGRRWFSVDSKTFKLKVVGEDIKVQVVITERRRGWISWIRFGEERARILLKSVESFRKEADKNSEGLEWRENGRRYKWELRKNHCGRFILCSIADLDEKRHRLFFPEGNGLINGWTLLEEALKATGCKENRGKNRKPVKTTLLGKAERHKGGLTQDKSFAF